MLVIYQMAHFRRRNLFLVVNGDTPDTLSSIGSGSFTYEYHLKDHLGSVRVAFTPTDSGKTVVQKNAYYPFGAPIAALSFDDPLKGGNRYKREGKEYISDFDWNKYDFGARTFDPWTLRALQIDPLAEKYDRISPYALWGNNPINVIDPDGRDWKTTTTIDENGKKHIKYTITAKVQNSASLSQEQITSYTNAIKSQIETSFQGKDKDVSYSTVVNFEFDSEINSGDFYIDFVNDVHDKSGNTEGSYLGMVDEIGNTKSNRIQIKANDDNAEGLARTGAHEIGHTGGLTHPAKMSNPKTDSNGVPMGQDNIMWPSSPGRTGRATTKEQLKYINRVIQNGYKPTPIVPELERLKPIYQPIRIGK